jgi:hypothetical protein
MHLSTPPPKKKLETIPNVSKHRHTLAIPPPKMERNANVSIWMCTGTGMGTSSDNCLGIYQVSKPAGCSAPSKTNSLKPYNLKIPKINKKQVTNYKLYFTSHTLQVIFYKSHNTSYILQVTHYKLYFTSHTLQVIFYRSQITS